MSGGYISFFNNSTVLSDADLADALPDFQSQVSNEFNWYWGLNAYLDINGGGSPIIIVDYPGPNDPQNALGYHYIDGNYQPYGVIFAGLCRDYGYPITGVISHEMLEMMADQLTDTVNLYDNGDGTGIIVIQEVCDPCELSLYYEGVNGNIVSDFALPAWWVPGDPNQVDYLGVIAGPWQLASGGYISYQSVTLSGWQQAFGDKAQQDIAKVAASIRAQLGATGNPRTDVVRQLQQQGQQVRGAQQFGAAATPTSQRKQIPRPLQTQQQGGLDRRTQQAKQAGELLVVKRKDVPQVGKFVSSQQQDMQQVGPMTQSQPIGQAGSPQFSAAARVQQKRASGGPKAQIMPNGA
jgi:hypothetical protein